MSLILGISSGLHDSSVALVKLSGEVMFAIQEERLTKIKGDYSFPALGLSQAIYS